MKRYADHEFTAETHATILALAAQLEAVIAEYPDHDAKHVRRIAKIGHKTAGFAREALDAAKANSELIPRGLDVDRFERALEQRNLLRTQLTQLSLLTEKVKTAMTLLGVDVYAYGLDVYSSLKRGKTPEVKATVQKLSRCFERKRRKKGAGEGEVAQAPSDRPQVEPRAAMAPGAPVSSARAESPVSGTTAATPTAPAVPEVDAAISANAPAVIAPHKASSPATEGDVDRHGIGMSHSPADRNVRPPVAQPEAAEPKCSNLALAGVERRDR